MEKSADEVLKEKWEERGWDQDFELEKRANQREEIKPLPLSNEEYQIFQNLLGKIALSDLNPALCELYFDIERRAAYGNGYLKEGNVEELESELWEIGMGIQEENIESRKAK